MRVLTLLSLFALGATASANLVTNPGFEMDSYPANGHVVPTTVTGWTQIPENVAGIGTGYLTRPVRRST